MIMFYIVIKSLCIIGVTIVYYRHTIYINITIIRNIIVRAYFDIILQRLGSSYINV
jgi:hypothetical protein